MTVQQFDNGYWYARAIKDFAKELASPASRACEKTSSKTSFVTIFVRVAFGNRDAR